LCFYHAQALVTPAFLTTIPKRSSTRLFSTAASSPPVDLAKPSAPIFSDAALWHRQRRKEMLAKYGDVIRPLEQDASSQTLAVPLLIVANLSLLGLSIWCGTELSSFQTILLGIFPGSILSLWQLQILHDVLHGSLFDKSATKVFGVPKADLRKATLFWGSLPCVFGYYLYLQFGHLSHHTNVGNAQQANLKALFESDQAEFEDGDVLFVAHRMKLLGDIGPTLEAFGQSITVSVSNAGFSLWRENNNENGEEKSTESRFLWNGLAFWASFLGERALLVFNDVIVSLTGRNWFFPNKPDEFHEDCARYARVATLLRLTLLLTCGWNSLLFLYLSETLWSLPPHPACAMFVTNHGSSAHSTDEEACWPSSSTYAGTWYSLLTLGTNYHTEHHDFPTIPFDQLYQLHKIAPEYYPLGESNVWEIERQAFSNPDFYACMNVGVGDETHILGN
jgi:fatty acid desaturase